MTSDLTLFDAVPAHKASAMVEIFDPPMCCPTGLCGPALDQTLLDVNQMVMTLRAEGLSVERYQLTSHPQAFLNNVDVMRRVREQQTAALPITIVNGRFVKSGAYATLDEVRAALAGTQA